MSESKQTPYDWLKTIPTALLKEDAIPLIRSPVEFPWEKVAKELAQNFHIQKLQLNPGEIRWRTAEELTSDFGEKASVLNFVIPSLEGKVAWVMAEKDVRLLMSELLNQSKDDLGFIHPDYVDGFYRYIANEVLFILSKTKFIPALSPQLENDKSLPGQSCLSLDVQFDLLNLSLIGRVLISSEMRRAWMQSQASATMEIPMDLSQKIFVDISVEAGRTALTLNEWKQVSKGDMIVLDSCSLIPGDEKGRVMLTLNGVPFFRAKIKQGSLKLLEHPLHYEVEDNMGKKISDDEDEFEHEDEESEEFHDEESEIDHDFEESEEHEDEEISEEHEDEEISEEHEEEEISEHDISEEGEEEAEKEGEEETAEGKHPVSAPLMKAEEIPLSIVVEVGRLRMSVQKLTELQPGNLLELNARPEDGVDLVVSGRRIAKGELLKIGDILGVRILDIG